MNRFPLLLPTLLVLSASAVRLPAQGSDALPSISAEEIREHVKFLASDALAGRGAGTEGDRGAENYIAGPPSSPPTSRGSTGRCGSRR